MGKSKRRIAAAARKRARKEAWKSMTPEARKEWSEKRLKTAKTGYAKRARERADGDPMAARPPGGPKHFITPNVRPPPEFNAWLRDFWRRTAV